MKTLFTLLLLPAIILIYFVSTRLYIDGNYVAAYTLVAAWFGSVVLFIRRVGQLGKRSNG